MMRTEQATDKVSSIFFSCLMFEREDNHYFNIAVAGFKMLYSSHIIFLLASNGN